MTLDQELGTAALTSGLSAQQRAEMIAAGEEVVVPPGSVPFREGTPAEDLWILLEGEVELSRRLGADTVVIATMSNPGQWAGGFQAWGDDTDAMGYRATGTALTEARFFRLPSPELARLMEAWFPFGKHMATGIFQTVRSIDALVRQRGSLIALGTMAAGLAHELNNPAAAARRAVDSLRTAGDRMVGALVAMADEEISADQYRALEVLRSELVDADPAALNPVARARQEDAVGELLASMGVDDAWRLAPVLVAAGFDVDAVGRAGELVGASALDGALQWIASTAEARQLLDELADTTERISNLVGAVRSFSQLDRASVQRVDLHEGLDSTLAMLNHKLRGVTVERRFAPDLPQVEVHPGELNQVWTNLIDNAVDAMDGSGELVLATRVDGGTVRVDIIDSGHGIPAEVMDRVFEPFFTTKDVGQGTGLGLDISRRIVVEHHHGTIDFATSSDGTTATVSLPIN
jgi:signal transduction histidine kinase